MAMARSSLVFRGRWRCCQPLKETKPVQQQNLAKRGLGPLGPKAGTGRSRGENQEPLNEADYALM